MSLKSELIVKEETLEEDNFLVEFAGLLAPNFLKEKFDQLNFIAVDSESPILQIQNTMFKGTFEPLLGTAVCFQQQNDCTGSGSSQVKGNSTDEDASTPPLAQFVAKANKRLLMKRVYVEPKQSSATQQQDSMLNPPSDSVEPEPTVNLDEEVTVEAGVEDEEAEEEDDIEEEDFVLSEAEPDSS